MGRLGAAAAVEHARQRRFRPPAAARWGSE
jgi:hypothetical protein